MQLRSASGNLGPEHLSERQTLTCIRPATRDRTAVRPGPDGASGSTLRSSANKPINRSRSWNCSTLRCSVAAARCRPSCSTRKTSGVASSGIVWCSVSTTRRQIPGKRAHRSACHEASALERPGSRLVQHLRRGSPCQAPFTSAGLSLLLLPFGWSGGALATAPGRHAPRRRSAEQVPSLVRFDCAGTTSPGRRPPPTVASVPWVARQSGYLKRVRGLSPELSLDVQALCLSGRRCFRKPRAGVLSRPP